MKMRGAVQSRGGMTLDEIGALLGITRERVRQIEAEALRKARRNAMLLGIRNPFALESDDQ